MRRTEMIEPNNNLEKWFSILGSVWPIAVAVVTGAATLFVLSLKADNAIAISTANTLTIEKIQDDRAAKYAALVSEISELKADTRSIKASLDRIDRKLDK